MLSLANYQIKEQIYESINSTVYRGIRNKDNQSVILKMLKQDYPNSAELTRYQQEYEIIHDLYLEGVIKVYSIEKYQNTLVIILEDFGGTSLRELMAFKPSMSSIPCFAVLQEFLPLAIQITDSLANIHVANIIHKDINPSNIVMNVEIKQLKIIDFGIASRLPRENPTLKNPEQLEGTLAYLSPEQTGRINRSMDYRTDLYSLGVMFYEMLTGRLPFDSTDAMELVHCHIAKTPVVPSEINSEIPHIISDIVMKLLAKNAEDRYQSAFGIKADLEKVLNLTGLQDLSGLPFKLGQNDFSGKFEIPQKLYGRVNEINTLLQTFDRVANGNTEMMLVAGYSGVGKTALVREVYKPMTKKRGFFAAGKFDQFQKNIPYSAITQAFNEFCRYLIMEDTKSLANWKSKILAAVGDNGQIIIDVVPDLELIIGEQLPVTEVGATEAQKRFQIFFLNFIKVLCDKNHPFILFIDDLQWVDSASLALLKNIMLDDEIQYLLIVGAYRSNEVDSSHPFIMTVDELQNAVINTIELGNLQLIDIKKLLQDTLRCKVKQSQKIADLVNQKTQGNAFFTHQFLHTLYEEELLQFKQQQWHWDIQQIANKNITANVVELMAKKIKKLPEITSSALQLAACIGNQFDLPILAIIFEHKQKETLSILHSAIIEGFIQPLDTNLQFKFLHDRVQQAAYALIDDTKKKAVHLKIGRLLLKNTSVDILEDKVFDIVGQFNHSIELVREQAERIEIAKLNLLAGQKAMNSTAYESALKMLNIGLLALSELWDSEFTLMFGLYNNLALCEYRTGQFKISSEHFDVLIQKSQSVEQIGKVYGEAIYLHTTMNEYEMAIKLARQGLARLDIVFPQDITSEILGQEFSQVSVTRGNRPILELLNSPMMTNPQKIAPFGILNMAIPSCWLAMPPGFIWCALQMVNLSQKYGSTTFSAFGYSIYALSLCGQNECYEDGLAYGDLAIALNNKIPDRFVRGTAHFFFNCFVQHWRRNKEQNLPFHKIAHHDCSTSGAYVYGVYNIIFFFFQPFYSDWSLTEVETYFRKLTPFAEQVNDQDVLGVLKLLFQVIANFKSLTKNPNSLNSDSFNEMTYLNELENRNYGNGLSYYYFSKMLVTYTHGDYELAWQMSRQVKPYYVYMYGLYHQMLYHFYTALIITARYQQDDKTNWQELQEHQKKFSLWQENCPENYQPYYELISAEIARLSGQYWEAINHYEQAIFTANKAKLLGIEALANELIAKFWLDKSKEEIAQIYLKKTHYYYQQWGAIAKVQQLEAKYPQLLTTNLSPNIDTTRTIMSSNVTRMQTSIVLDLDSITKASQTLTGEINLNKLLERMMHIVIENAGAERGFLLLPQDEIWFIEAEGAIDKQEVTILNSLPIEQYLPEAIISYVGRTKENVRLDNASQDGLYTENSYIKTHQTQSVLCFPIIYQQQLRAILYFENNLITGAFTPQRLKVLTMLSSQIAISLENAQVMANLDNKVKERTTQLNTKVEELTQTRHELIQSEKMASLGRLVAGFAHELNTPLGVAIGSASMLQRKAKQVNDLMEQEEVDVDELLASLKSIDKGSDLTLFNLERAANLVTSFKRTAVDQTSDEARTFHVHQVMNDIITNLNSKFKKTEITIQANCPNNIKIKSLPGALEQILTNLLMNSYTHGFNEGKNSGIIKLKVQLNEEQLHLEYSDNGKGIAPENLAKIFEPFFTTNRSNGGSGLGMYIVFNLVSQKLDGTIKVQSEVGVGTKFILNLPLS